MSQAIAESAASSESKPSCSGEFRIDDVVANDQLKDRPSRTPDWQAENIALVELADILANQPEKILQSLVDAALRLTSAGSAGISILEHSQEQDVFRWRATAGAFKSLCGGTLPRGFSPCGTVLDRNAVQLMQTPERFFPYISQIKPQVVEVLLIPFYKGLTPIGTVWVVSHGSDKQFDSEDARLVSSISKFAAAAVQVLAAAEEQVRTTESLREMRDVAEAANRSKDRFLAILSHELRTPLSPVVMTLPAMEIDPQLPDKFREDLAMIRRNIELEVRLIDDLLDISRVISGKLRLHVHPLNAHEVIHHTIYGLVSETSGKRVEVQTELHAENDRLIADSARVQQVLWNLLRNAVKFTPAAGKISVRTWNEVDNKRLHIEVRDTGVGIPPEMLHRVFDAFEQGEARMTKQFGGLGLGLAISKAVVEMHGGTLSAFSSGQDERAVFTITFDTVNEAVVPSQPAPTPKTDKKFSSRQSRILLVEDHPDTARILSRLLKHDGFEVSTAGSVSSALQLAAAQPFDVVVSNIGLPDATGYDLMKQIRHLYGIKGVALTGYGMEEDAMKSRDAGFAEHVVKPINVQQLQAIIRRLLHVDK